MFNRNDAPPPSGDDTAGTPMSVPEVPPRRKFILRRLTPEAALTFDDETGNYTNIFETAEILAHDVEINAAGNVLRFREYLIDPDHGPTNRIVKCVNGWLDYEEVVQPRVPLGITLASGLRFN